MDIRNSRELKAFALERLANAREEKRIILIYAGLILGLTAFVTVANYVIGMQIDNFGGLSNLGKRTTLSSVQSMLPIAQTLVTMCLDVGFLAAMLRIARGQYASPQTLRLGFDRFWVLLRSTVIRSLLYTAHVFLGVYLGIMLFMLTPLSGNVMEILAPYVSELTVLDSSIVLEDAVYAQFAQAMVPAYVICGIVLALLVLPVMYSYRMVYYVIIDRPAMGAMAALRESKRMMRGNRLKLLRLDLSFWWYYGAMAAAYGLCYGDVILPMLGIELPFGDEVGYFVFFALYLAALFGIYYFLRNRVDVVYGLAYDAIKPKEKQDGGVVLGNIFQM